MKIKLNLIIDCLYIIFGTALMAVGISWFLTPLNITAGGLTGVATMLAYLFSLPAGTVLFILNLPLLISGFLKLGKMTILKTLIASFFYSVFIDIFDSIKFIPSRDIIICALCGGVIIGVGMAIILMRGATSGGTDIAAKLLQLKFPYLSTGRLILILDAVIIGASVFVYDSLELSLYAILSIVISTIILDRILSGGGGGKVAFIITESPKEVKEALFLLLHRGVTEIKITGGYSGNEKTLLLCALRRQQIGEFHKAVKSIKSGTFIMVADAGEIMGLGFN